MSVTICETTCTISQLTVIFRGVNIHRNSLQSVHTSQPFVKLQDGLPSVACINYELLVTSAALKM